MPESLLEILKEQNPDAIPADSPPSAANYRPADVEGVGCATCTKFIWSGEDEEGVPTGYCDQWEAYVRGDQVSDGYAESSPPLDENGDEQWDFADDHRAFAEVHLTGTEVREEEGYLVKEILTTGEWPVIPVKGGVINKPLKIVRDGKSDAESGTIAMAEVLENFKAGAIPNPQIPLSDDEEDHKNITRVNTGFIRDLWIVDENDRSKLVAKMEFTEPEVREKCLRGTYADVSCGIPWKVRSRGKDYGACLEHVAITNRPFQADLGPFLAASDDEDADAKVTHFGDSTAVADAPEVVEEESGDQESEAHRRGEAIDIDPDMPSYEEQRRLVGSALVEQLNLNSDYEVTDIRGQEATVVNRVAETSWTVPFEINDGQVKISAIENWNAIGSDEEDEGSNDDEPSARTSEAPRSSEFSELDSARRLRELRLSQSNHTTRKEKQMPLTREELDALNLSDEQRAAFTEVLDENATLTATTREQEVESRIAELSELGLKERPGALKLYRQVALADDGGPAAVLLSDGGQKEQITAKEILDRFIEGIKGSDEKVQLSDQALVTDDPTKPPADAEGEVKPLDERLAAAKQAIGRK